jgi:pilus assembly protein CpaB
MKTSRYVIMGVAALAAIVLAFLVRGLISQKPAAPVAAAPQAIKEAVPTVKILVAARDLKPGSRIVDADLSWQEWPQNLLNPNFIVETSSVTKEAADDSKPIDQAVKAVESLTKAADSLATGGQKAVFIGGVVREPILANEPIIETKIVRADKGGFLAVMLEPGERAMAVPVSVESTAGGFILPGDHVDIIATVSVPRSGGGNNNYITPVLSNIKVLAIDQQVSAEKDRQSVIGATATLAVTPKEAEVLALAKASGSLSLTLRSYADVGGSSGIIKHTPDGANAEDSKPSVKVFRNGTPTDEQVLR